MNAMKSILASSMRYRMSRMLRGTLLLTALFLLFVSTTSHAGEYCIKGEGQGHVFCEEIVKMLNRTEPTLEKLPCISELLFKMPGVSEPPWEKLDLAQHEQLATNIWLISQKGFYGFFDEPSYPIPDYWPKPEAIAQYPDYLRKNHAELFVFRSPIVPDKAFVTLRIPSHPCGSRLELRGESSKSAWVSSDLKQMERMIASPVVQRPLLYRGQLYFSSIGGNTEMDLSRLIPGGSYPRVCNIFFNSSDTHNCKGRRK